MNANALMATKETDSSAPSLKNATCTAQLELPADLANVLAPLATGTTREAANALTSTSARSTKRARADTTAIPMPLARTPPAVSSVPATTASSVTVSHATEMEAAEARTTTMVVQARTPIFASQLKVRSPTTLVPTSTCTPTSARVCAR